MEPPTAAETTKPGLNIRICLENDETVEVLDNTELPENFKKDILSPYLRHLYDDLASRAANPSVGISKTIFLNFLNMGGLIGDRVFHLYDLNKNNYIDLIEFVTVSCRFFNPSFESKLKLVFDIFDVDSDGLVSGEDIRGILSHMPLDLITTCRSPSNYKHSSLPNYNSSMEVYLDRVQSQEELGRLIEVCFKDKSGLSFADFKELIENVCSDMFLCVYLYLRSHLPLYDQVYLYAKKIKKVAHVNSPTMKHVISSPRVLSRFSPVASMVRRNSFHAKRSNLSSEEKREPDFKIRKSTFLKDASPDPPKQIGKMREREEDFTSAMGEDSPSDGETHARKLPTLKVNSNDLNWLREQKASKDGALIQQEISGDVVRISTQSKKVSQFYIPPVEAKEDSVPVAEETEDFKEVVAEEAATQFVLYCGCGNQCEYDHSLCKKCLEKQKPIEFSGHLYAHVCSGLGLCWFRLLNKELYGTL